MSKFKVDLTHIDKKEEITSQILKKLTLINKDRGRYKFSIDVKIEIDGLYDTNQLIGEYIPPPQKDMQGMKDEIAKDMYTELKDKINVGQVLINKIETKITSKYISIHTIKNETN